MDDIEVRKSEEVEVMPPSDVSMEDSIPEASTVATEEEGSEVLPPVTVKESVAVADPVPTPTTPVPTPSTVEDGYTLADVRMHSSATSCWSVINGQVYDLTEFVSKHPGGEKRILRICGTDGTAAFEDEHGGDSKPESILVRYHLGEFNG